MRLTIVMIAALALAGCGSKPDATGASPSEARQLDDAAASLDANTVDPNGSDTADNGAQ